MVGGTVVSKCTECGDSLAMHHNGGACKCGFCSSFKGPVVTIRQTKVGNRIEVKNRYGDARNVTIDREWEVVLLGEVIGHIRYAMITRERRTPGRRYVNARWESPGWQYQSEHYYYWFEGFTKKESIERLVRDAQGRKRDALT